MKNFAIPLRPGLDKIDPYQPGKPVEEVEREFGIAHAIKLASNENPLGPSPAVKQALQQAAKQAHIYPDGAGFYLHQALARYLKVAAEQIILGNGSNELLVLLGRCFLKDGDEVLTSQMSFVVYSLVANMMNAKLVAVPMRDYTYDLQAMARAITRRTRIIYIANPNNPTGTCLAPKALAAFLRKVPATCLLVLDEAYYEYVDKQVQWDSLAWVKRAHNIAVLRTFSKAYALAGLRVGYGVVSPAVARVVNRVRDPFNVNSLAQAAACAALGDLAHVRKAVELARRERKRISDALSRRGLQVVPSQTNFIFIKVGNVSGKEFSDLLMRQGVIVRPFPGPHVRITLGTAAQNNKLVRAIEQVLTRTRQL